MNDASSSTKHGPKNIITLRYHSNKETYIHQHSTRCTKTHADDDDPGNTVATPQARAAGVNPVAAETAFSRRKEERNFIFLFFFVLIGFIEK